MNTVVNYLIAALLCAVGMLAAPALPSDVAGNLFGYPVAVVMQYAFAIGGFGFVVMAALIGWSTFQDWREARQSGNT